MMGDRAAARLVSAVPWLGALLVTGPLLLHRGFWSFGDMVFTPFQPWKPEWYGGDGGVPRAVPSDALVSLATHLVPGDLVQKAVLFLLMGCAGWGVVRLLAGAPPVAAAVACMLYQWNPYVFERLAIGHWALLCGYAALPWVVSGAVQLANHGSRRWPALFVASAIAAWTSPTGGVLAALMAIGTSLAVSAPADRWRRTLTVVIIVAMVNLPWLVPGVLATAGASPDPLGADAFAARSDTPYGAMVSFLTLGGIWKSSVVPDERGSAAVVALGLVVVLVALVGVLLALRSHLRRPLATGLALTAVPLFAFTALSSTDPGGAVVEWVIVNVPGGGLVRDSQKWLAAAALLMAFGAGAFAEWVTNRFQPSHGRQPVVWLAGLAVLPVLALPSLAWGNLGNWPVTDYPDEWSEVADLVAAESETARPTTLVLPFSTYRRFSWNGERAWLDPAPRILEGRVLVDDTLLLADGREVAGESPVARQVRRSLTSWADLDPVLDEIGVRFVLVEKSTPGQLPGGDPERLGHDLLYDGDWLSLYDRGESTADVSTPGWARWLVVLDTLLATAFLLACAKVMRNGISRCRRAAAR